ncbi:MAG: ABC transporter permease [Pseudomonadales bacterium]|jgi:putative ABC transport system permease protein|nr:ABC transporter permease [Pseudomonadales bacterium]MCP5321287.1 ABC transporter permease [Pseudomonadales bacterium]MCP5336201.1 ABC transporter permease [Pseudomonadales bacterium]
MEGSLRLAFRNLWRNRRRSTIALATIGFGVVALVLAGGFIEWIFWAMRTATIESQLGHIQVVKRGYFEAGAADPFAYLLPDDSPTFAELEHSPGVLFVTPRIAFTGLVSHGDLTVSFAGEGVDPIKERTVSKMVVITAGQNLSGPDASELIMGTGLARNLGVELGDQVVLLVNTAAGGINAVELKLVGTFTTSTKAFDDSALRVPIGVAHTLLRTQGAHRWVLLLDDESKVPALIDDFRQRFTAADANTTLQFVPWQQLADFYNKTVALFSRQMDVVKAIIGLIIVLSISNLLVMTVMERTGEIGTLMAVGYRRRSILRLMFSEGLLLGVVGGALGTLVAVVLALGISAVGIPMPPPPGSDTGFTGEIRLTVPLVAGAFVLAVVVTALAAVYPAWKASRLEVVNALRHNR